MWQEEPGDRAGVIELHAIELSAYRKRGKEKEKKRAMRCHDWWPTTFCLSSILKLILHAPTAIFFSFPQSSDLARQAAIFQSFTEWEYGNLVNNMFTLSFDGMNTEHVKTELIYKNI